MLNPEEKYDNIIRLLRGRTWQDMNYTAEYIGGGEGAEEEEAGEREMRGIIGG